jgi:hypothetical protein
MHVHTVTAAAAQQVHGQGGRRNTESSVIKNPVSNPYFGKNEFTTTPPLCVHALTVNTRIDCGFQDLRQEEALNWQPEQGDDEDEVEVLYHLKQLAETTLALRRPEVRSQRTRFSNSGTIALVANVQFWSFN